MTESKAQHPDDLAAYALGILPRAEADAVEEHLQACVLCREALRAYEAVGAELARAAPPVDPPPALEKRLLAQVAPRPVSRPGWAARLRAWVATTWSGSMLRPAGVATALLALVLFILLLWPDRPAGGTFPLLALAGTGPAPQASGLVISSDDGQHGTLVVQHLPPLVEDAETYQLWLIEAGAWEDGGTFSVDEDGYAAHYARADISLTAYDAFAVTVEPAGGSATPAGPVLLRGER